MPARPPVTTWLRGSGSHQETASPKEGKLRSAFPGLAMSPAPIWRFHCCGPGNAPAALIR